MRTIDYDNLESLLVRYQQTHEQKLTRAEVKLIDTVLFELAEMSDNGWISVKERPPENHEPVFVYSKRTGREIACYTTSNKWICNDGNYAYDVTHWMPLPELPKEEREE